MWPLSDFNCYRTTYLQSMPSLPPPLPPTMPTTCTRLRVKEGRAGEMCRSARTCYKMECVKQIRMMNEMNAKIHHGQGGSIVVQAMTFAAGAKQIVVVPFARKSNQSELGWTAFNCWLSSPIFCIVFLHFSSTVWPPLSTQSWLEILLTLGPHCCAYERLKKLCHDLCMRVNESSTIDLSVNEPSKFDTRMNKRSTPKLTLC